MVSLITNHTVQRDIRDTPKGVCPALSRSRPDYGGKLRDKCPACPALSRCKSGSSRALKYFRLDPRRARPGNGAASHREPTSRRDGRAAVAARRETCLSACKRDRNMSLRTHVRTPFEHPSLTHPYNPMAFKRRSKGRTSQRLLGPHRREGWTSLALLRVPEAWPAAFSGPLGASPASKLSNQDSPL